MPYFWMSYIAVALFLFWVVGRPFFKSDVFDSIFSLLG
jgi:hypothetical protein